MAASGRNIMKIIIGSAIGSAVAAFIARRSIQDDTNGEERMPFTESVKTAPVRLRDRWEQAKAAGVEAEAETEAHLSDVFRDKVNDPDALKPPRPPSR